MKSFVGNSYRQLRQRFDRKRFSYWSSIDFLPVLNFFLVIEKEDLRYLLKLKDYEKLPSCWIDLSSIWEKIMEQYYEAEGSNAITIYFNNYKALHRLELQYQVVWNIYNVLIIEPDNKEILEIAKGYKIKTVKDAEQKLKGLNNKKKLKQKEIEKFNIDDQKKSFDEVVDMIEDAKGRTIDTSTVTVKKWIAIKKNLVNKQKKAKQNGRQNKS